MRSFNARKTGFTIVEFIAVVGVLAALTAILLVSLRAHRAKISLPILEQPLAESASPAHLSEPHFVANPTGGARPNMIALAGGTTLVFFDVDTPETSTFVVLAGLNIGELVLAIDSNVRTGQLFGVTNQNRVVLIDPDTGDVTTHSLMNVGFNDASLKNVATIYNFYIDSAGLFENSFGAGEKWLRSDSTATTQASQGYFYILPDGRLFEWQGVDGLVGNQRANLGVNAYKNPELIVGASQTMLTAEEAEQALAADNERHFYRASKGNFQFNFFGLGERWIKGEVSKKRSTNNPWYFILPTGEVREWDGSSNPNTGATLGVFSPKIHLNPALIYNANQVNEVNSKGFDRRFRFFFDRFEGCVRNLYEDGTLGSDLKWFIGASNRYYYIRPNGQVVQWDGITPAGGITIANFGPQAWDNIEQVVNDFKDPTDNAAELLDYQRCFYRASDDGDFFFNSSRQLEKWIVGDRLAKTVGRTNPYYYILPNGDVVEWDGGTNPLTGVVVDNFPQAYDDPNWLCDAYADGTVLNNAAPNPFMPGIMSAPGDRLNDGVLDLARGVGADFDPVRRRGESFERFTVVTGNDQNLRIDVTNGMVTVNPNVNPARREIPALAYIQTTGALIALSNNNGADNGAFFNTDTGTYGIPFFFIQNSDQNMGLEIIGDGGFGLTPTGSTFSILTVNGRSQLFSRNAMGASVLEGSIVLDGRFTNTINDITVDCR